MVIQYRLNVSLGYSRIILLFMLILWFSILFFIFLCVRGIGFSHSFYNFAIRFWSCPDSVVVTVFLLDFGAVLTAVFTVFLLDFGAVLTVWYFLFCFSFDYNRYILKSSNGVYHTFQLNHRFLYQVQHMVLRMEVMLLFLVTSSTRTLLILLLHGIG